MAAEADALAARFRAYCVAMEKPPAERIFANVYTEPHHQLEAQQREYLKYLVRLCRRRPLPAERTR